jgi:hypothetical protein
MTIETFVGPRTLSDGRGEGRFRTDQLASLVITDSHGRWYELASRGRVFSCHTAVTGATIAAGHVAPPAAAAATTLTLSNPVGSGVNLEIIAGMLLHLTGTPGTGSWSWCGANAIGATVITATENAAPKPLLLGGANSSAKGYSATALTTGPLHAVHRLFPSAVFAGAIDAATQGKVAIDYVDGSIVVPPGWVITLAPPAAGTDHVVAAGILYAEITIPG